MALTYEESSRLMQDMTFQGRVKVACLNYAQYIMLEPPSTASHNTRLKWANSTFLSPTSAATTVTPPTVMNPNVQNAPRRRSYRRRTAGRGSVCSG